MSPVVICLFAAAIAQFQDIRILVYTLTNDFPAWWVAVAGFVVHQITQWVNIIGILYYNRDLSNRGIREPDEPQGDGKCCGCDWSGIL